MAPGLDSAGINLVWGRKTWPAVKMHIIVKVEYVIQLVVVLQPPPPHQMCAHN